MAEPDDPDADDEGGTTLVRAALLGFVALLAVLAILAVMLARTVVPEVTEDGPLAERRLAELLTVRLPEGFRPAATLDWNLLYLIPMRGVWVEGPQGAELTLLRLGGRVADDETLRQRAAEALGEPSGGRSEIESSVPLALTLRGREVSVPLLTLRDAAGDRWRRFNLSIPTDEGPVLLEWRQKEAAFETAVVRQTLASIR